MFAKVIFEELDQHKNGSNSRLRNGSRRLRRELEGLLERELHDHAPAPIRTGVWATFRLQHSAQALADTPRLSEQHRDDVLVASMLAFRTDHPERDLVLVSDDGGPRVTARSFELRVFEPPDDLRLPDQRDAQEKELADTRRELQRIRDARRKLDVRFAGIEPGKPLDVALAPAQILTPKGLAAAIERERQRRALTDSASERAYMTGFLAGSGQLERYNSELEAYLERFKDYLPKLWNYQEGRKRSFELRLEMWNRGAAVADDVDIYLHFPDGFSLTHDDEDAKVPPAPKPPSLPRSPYEEMMRPLGLSDAFRHINYQLPMPDVTRGLDPSVFRIRRSQSFELETKVRRIKPGTGFAFSPLRAQFDSDASVPSFSLQYRLHPVQLPEAVDGELHVVVKR